MKSFFKALAAVMFLMAIVFAAGSITNLEPNTAYHVRAYALHDTVCYYGDDKIFITEEDPGNYDGHDYVDLGLPSGTLWATCNVGAHAPEEFGDYFAWGETEPKDRYDWSNYKWCNSDDNQLTKYCSNASSGYNGFTDNLFILESCDDAASVYMGSEWHTPSAEEIDELVRWSLLIWKTMNGIKGCLCIGPNGNNIFVPAAGYYEGNEYVNYVIEDEKVGSYPFYGCYYWTNRLSSDQKKLPIRAVRSAK